MKKNTNRYYAAALAVACLAGFASEVRADYLDGLAAMVKGDFKAACAEFGALAEQGDAKAQIKVGEMHVRGQCGPKNEEEAAKWYLKAAQQGNSEAQVYMGVMYANGKGVTQNDAEAATWYAKAAEQGNPVGQGLLGQMYSAGKGVTKSDAEAITWYRKAAEQGNSLGQRLLGGSYADGLGVEQDYVQAYMWLTLAFEKGDPLAGGVRSTFSGKMKAEQIAEAKRLAGEWRPVKAKKGK